MLGSSAIFQALLHWVRTLRWGACGKGGIMAEPLIFVTTLTLKEGKLEDFKHHSEQMGKFVEANEPRIIHFEQYISEDGTEVTGVQIHPDEDSMTFHMQVAAERSEEHTSELQSRQY